MKPALLNASLLAGSTALTLRPALQSLIRPCIGARFASVRRETSRPSRMVLSDNVHRSPPSANDARRKRHAPGPFGAMNKRVANIDPRRQPRAPASADKRSDATRKHGDDRKALKMHRALASISYGRRTSMKGRMAEYESFSQFDLLPSVQTAIDEELFKGMTDIRPTPVQRLAIPALLGQSATGFTEKTQAKAPTSIAPGKVPSFLLAAETGSGKTLAYLLPAINALKQAEAIDPDIAAYNERFAAEKKRQEELHGKGKPFDEPHPTMARPKVVVLVPTAELCQQVMRVSKSVSHAVKFKTEMLSSDLKPQQIQRNVYSPRGLDVVVATPHLLAAMADSDPNILSRVSHLIIDEADSLFDRSFAPVTMSIVERATPSLKQLICCSATIPRKLNNYLAVNYPDMKRIVTPNLHAIPRRVQLGVIDVSRDPYRNNKDLACAEAIFSIGRESAQHEGPAKDEVDVRRIMVFVNEREKTEELADYLRSKGIDAQALHRDTPEKRHGEILEVFTKADPLRVARPDRQVARGWLSSIKVLVVTDLASRGIDTVAVRHVILYDVPHTTIDFIHRLGRAGRMGRRGRGIVLVGNDDRRDIVADVKKSMFMGQALI
ncbi:DEAD-like helicase [Cordyceps fumosorosea ARSEF 2679]|uniref:RNA helicase n=1 Tax=Cordyceps fumosorosea (strain ARSEF 2679) TaxID=1081104 RepID=A0A168ESQ6_CORFA|nr:DEAD-like helicase [Cordyceps fumosorosea ARSEF 2679]OAA74165.1 DEAD-like helicase [Cordyceps fumosorosea ARSEF 2679]